MHNAQIRRGLRPFPCQASEGVIPFSNLSDRELIALRFIVRGGDLNTVAAALLVNRDVVIVLRKRLLAKFRLTSDDELIDFGRNLRLS